MRRLGFVLLFITSLLTCRKPHEQNPGVSGSEFNIVYSTPALEQALAAVRSPDGGYVLAGSIQSVSSNPTYSDAWVLKVNNQGKEVWQKRFGGADNDCGNSIASTQNGGYIIAGYTNSNDGDVAGNHGKTDGWVVKLDKDGNKEWQRTLGGSANDNVTAIVKTSDGGYIIAGQTESIDGDVSNNHGRTDAWTVKLDINGNKLWQKTFGGTGSEGANAVIETSEGGYIMTGWTNSNDGDVTGYHVGWGMWVGNIDGWVVALNKDGGLLWNQAFGGVNTDVIYSIVQGVNKSYTIAGYTRSNYDGDVGLNHGGEDGWLFNVDKNGKILWRKNIGGSGNDIANCVISAPDAGYLLAGFTSSGDGGLSGNHGGEDAWFVRLNQDGGEQWLRMLGGSGNDVARVVIQRAEGGYLMVGASGSSDGDVSAPGGAWIITIKEE